MKLPAKLKGCRGVVLDTMVWIYLLEDHPDYGAVSEWLLLRAEAGDFAGLVTPISMAEIMVKPLGNRRPDLADRYRLALRNAANITMCDFTWQTGTLAGALRAKHGLPLPDMFQVACAMEHGGVLVTNDAALRKIDDIHVVFLSDLNGLNPQKNQLMPNTRAG